MKQRIVINQSIVDIAIMRYGSAEGIVLLMLDNPVSVPSLNTELVPGTLLNITSPAIDASIVSYYDINGIAPATWPPLIDAPIEGDFLLTEDLQVILTEAQTPIQLEQSDLLTEDGDNITTEDNQDLLTE